MVLNVRREMWLEVANTFGHFVNSNINTTYMFPSKAKKLITITQTCQTDQPLVLLLALDKVLSAYQHFK